MARPAEASPPAFGAIEFGFADARKEGAEAPELLLQGFFDDTGLSDEAISGPAFLFLGYKGSGKTALAERARLLAERDPMLFVTAVQLEDFSYGDFRSLAGNADDVEARFPTAWAWLLLLSLIQSLERDEQGRINAPSSYTRVVDGLRSVNLLPLPQFTQLVTKTSTRGFKAMLPKFLEYSEQHVAEASELHMMHVVTVLREAVAAFPTASRHVLFIDGVDEVLSPSQLQLQALAALISEASRLNDFLRSHGRLSKVVVLCRTDIFDRLPGANKNKIRLDSARTLEWWFDDPGEPDRTPLVKLVNLRAGRSLGRRVNVFDEFFPAKVERQPIRRYLLQHTRHLPRDVLQLMKSMQRFAPRHSSGPLSADQVRSAIRAYSNNYFLPELRDELHGYLDTDDIETSIRLLASLRSDRFRADDLRAHADALGLGSLDLNALLRTLFECSGIGMVETTRKGRTVFTFRYRNRNAVLLPGARMMVHHGAWKALNIQSSRPTRTR